MNTMRQSDCSPAALQAYDRAVQCGNRPSIRVIVAALKSCSRSGDLTAGRRIHRDAVRSGDVLNKFVAATVVDMYAKMGQLGDARSAFESIGRQRRTAVSWNCLMMGYTAKGEGYEALQLYERMQQEGCVPDAVTFLAASKACSCAAEQEASELATGRLKKEACLERGRMIHASAEANGALSKSVVSSLVEMYAKCGSMEEARFLFERLQENGEAATVLELHSRMEDEDCRPNSVTYIALLKAYACLASGSEQLRRKCVARLREIRRRVRRESSNNAILSSALVTAFAKLGSMEEAVEVFESAGKRDAVLWNSVMLAYAENGEAYAALAMYRRMVEEGCDRNAGSFVAALRCCSLAGELEMGKELHAEATALGFRL